MSIIVIPGRHEKKKTPTLTLPLAGGGRSELLVVSSP
jgi:hypothetical protein